VLDADRILPNLWQGSRPPVGDAVKDAGFDALVLCEDQFQPHENQFPGVEVIRAPMIDDPTQPPPLKSVLKAYRAARRAFEIARSNRKVLVCCHAGLNRSGFVCALVAHLTTGASGNQCIALIRARRSIHALSNPKFAEMIGRLKPATQTVSRTEPGVGAIPGPAAASRA
jgi:protein-tyrosine phosphatase